MSVSFRHLSTALAFAFLFAVWSAPAPAQTPQETAKAVPPIVESISTGGAWVEKDRQGSYRIVVLIDPSAEFTTRLFLQWIAFKEDKKSMEIVSSVPVKEVNSLGVLGAYAYFEAEQENKIVIQIQAFGPEENRERNFALTATTPGKYKIEELSKDTLEEKPSGPAKPL